ncbi:MAG: NADH-quinone oxidoreductase subunit N [Armatimonadetes bacterium]|nr:NADH-quinone oxidoreductase subunit N [Armatimonadota bacterium]
MQITPRDIWNISPHLVVAALGLIILLIDAIWPRISKRQLANLALLGLIGAGALQARFWPRGQVTPVLGGMIVPDGYTAFFNLVLLVGAGISLLLSTDYLEWDGSAHGEYHALVLFTAFGGMVMAAAGHLIVVFLGLEILSISLYILAGYQRERRESQEAALKYFLLGAFASAFFLYGMALVYGYAGSLDLHAIARAAGAGQGAAANQLLLTGIGLLLVGFGFKVAVVPFHIWTPDVYEGAPTSATAFMSVVAKAAGFAAFVRVFALAFPGADLRHQVGAVVASIAMLTMVVGNTAAVLQTNIKRLLAYSSIAHAGYILVGVVAVLRNPAAPAEGVSAVLFYTLAYTFMNLGAFAVVLALRRRGEELLNIEEYAGLGFRYPWLGALMALFMLSLAGMPPTAGFFAKLYLIRAALSPLVGMWWLVITLALTSVVSFYYYIRVVTVMYMRPAVEGEQAPQASAGPHLGTGLALAALGTILLGLIPAGILQAAQQIAEGLVELGGMALR